MNNEMKLIRNTIVNEHIKNGLVGEDLEDALHDDPRYPKDRLVKITSYDLKNNKILGLLKNDNQKFEIISEIIIHPSSFKYLEEELKNNIASGKIQKPEWSGHKIDENMEKSIPVNSTILLRESVLDKTDSTVLLVAARILKVNIDLTTENNENLSNSQKLTAQIKSLRFDSSNNLIKPKKT